jgi:hypothetical protein
VTDAPRAELELQAKLEDLETASQAEGESIREWTLRLRCLALEVQAMSGQHVITDTAHKLKLLRKRPFAGAEEGYNTFLAGIRYSLHVKSVQQIEQELIAYEDGIQMRTRLIPVLITHKCGTLVQAPLLPPLGHSLQTILSSFRKKSGLVSSASMQTHHLSQNTTCAIAQKRAHHSVSESMSSWTTTGLHWMQRRLQRMLQRELSRSQQALPHQGLLMLQVLASD